MRRHEFGDRIVNFHVPAICRIQKQQRRKDFRDRSHLEHGVLIDLLIGAVVKFSGCEYSRAMLVNQTNRHTEVFARKVLLKKRTNRV